MKPSTRERTAKYELEEGVNLFEVYSIGVGKTAETINIIFVEECMTVTRLTVTSCPTDLLHVMLHGLRRIVMNHDSDILLVESLYTMSSTGPRSNSFIGASHHSECCSINVRKESH